LRTSEQVSALVIKALRKYLKEALPLYRLSEIKGMARRANRRACSWLSPQPSGVARQPLPGPLPSEAAPKVPLSRQARMSASFCKAPRPALITTGAPIGLRRLSLENAARLRVCRVSSVSGSGQTWISVRRRKASNSALPLKHSTPSIAFFTAAPAGDAKTDALEHLGRVRPE
jgi:hypothetical protein